MRLKLAQLPLQMDTGYHGAIRALAGEELKAGDLVAVAARRGAYLQVVVADATRANYTMLFVADHGCPEGEICRCVSYKISDAALPASAKLGDPIYLGTNGTSTTRTTLKKPRIVGTVIDDDGEFRALLAPTYGA